ncbi:MAG: putative two-component sensor histidine kinase, partial [Herminiimonas sp.]|nr:putative two-component sensor histidine kinase [Herminiimonas sp.]
HPIHIAATGESGSLVVQVKNQGTIIPPSSLQSIFNPLVQLAKGHESDHRPATSLGLGLFIAREITEAHDGTIAVESSEKEGTTFTVRLPREPSHKAQAGSAS